MSAVSGTSPQFDPWTDGLAQHGDKTRLGKLTPVEVIKDVVPLDRQFGIWPKRCVSEPAAMGTQSLGSLLVAVSGKVVEDHHGSRLDLRDQDLANPGCEGGTVHCALDAPRGDQGIRCEAGDQGLCSPAAEGRIHGQACATQGPAPQAGKIGLRRGFVYENHAFRPVRDGRQAMCKPVGSPLYYPKKLSHPQLCIQRV